jgi:hypothetical protein
MRVIAVHTVLWGTFILIAASTRSLAPGAANPMEGSPSFAVSPLRFSATTSPGGTVSGTFIIQTRNTKAPTRFAVEVADVGQRNNGTPTPVALGKGSRSCASWIAIPAQLEVPTDTRREVPYTLRCPASSSGSYHAFLLVRLERARERRPFATLVEPEMAVELDVCVRGPARMRVTVDDFVIEAGPDALTHHASLQITNNGVWKTSIEGDVLLYAQSGGWPVRCRLPEGTGGRPLSLYPGITLTLKCRLPRALSSGHYGALVRLLLNGKVEARSRFDLDLSTAGAQPSHGTLTERAELDVPLLVEPDVVEVSAPPGARRTAAIRIRNQAQQSASLKLDVANVRLEADGMLTVSQSTTGNGQNWVTVSPGALTLRPKASAAAHVYVQVPRDANSGSSSVKAVLIRGASSAGRDSEGWASSAEFPVLIVVQDPKSSAASLLAVGSDIVRKSPQHNPTAVALTFTNAGGRVAKATGRITLERTSGQEIAHMDIGAAQPELILPGGEREFRMPIPPLDKGKFRIRAEISPGPGGGEKAVAEEEFETYVDIPEGLRDAVETPPATEPGESDTGAEKKPETPPAPDPSREGDFRP